MVEWDRSSAKPKGGKRKRSNQDPSSAPPNATSLDNIRPHPLIASFDSSLYASHDSSIIRRRWGLNEGLCVEANRFSDESDASAIKRLLFQRKLFQAVEDGDNGDIAEVRRLVTEWQPAYASGARMHPLCYRADSDWMAPLQTAVSYEKENVDILKLLLQLPHCYHIQSKAKESVTRLTLFMFHAAPFTVPENVLS